MKQKLNLWGTNFKIFIAIVVMSFVREAIADGTVGFSKVVVPIVKQKPFLYDLIDRSCVFSEATVAVRLGQMYKHIAGIRVGPYVARAKCKDSSGQEKDVKVIFFTEVVFLDKNGGVAKDEYGAVSVDEKFSSISIDSM